MEIVSRGIGFVSFQADSHKGGLIRVLVPEPLAHFDLLSDGTTRPASLRQKLSEQRQTHLPQASAVRWSPAS